MPVTPFHFGLGVPLEAIAPRYFSLTVFCLVQVMIDTEVAFAVLLGRQPIHGFFHTYVGASLVAACGVAAARPVCGRAKRLWNSRLDRRLRKYLQVPEEISFPAALTGAVAGAYSHVWFDSMMHVDIRPLAPWSPDNAMLDVLSPTQLHVVCVLTGALAGC